MGPHETSVVRVSFNQTITNTHPGGSVRGHTCNRSRSENRGASAKILVVVDSYAEGVRMVTGEEVYDLIADYPICVVAALRAGDLSTLPAALSFEPVGVAMPPNDPLFMNIVQNYLKSLEDIGVLARLRAKWFGDASWVRDLPDLE